MKGVCQVIDTTQCILDLLVLLVKMRAFRAVVVLALLCLLCGSSLANKPEGAPANKPEGIEKGHGDHQITNKPAPVEGAPDLTSDETEQKENDQGHVQKFSGKGKITVISNKNTLSQLEAAPKQIDRKAVMEQHKKSEQEENQKRDSEEKAKLQHEELNKKERAAADKREQQREEARKRSLTEQTQKKTQEEDAKAKRKEKSDEQAAKAKERREQQADALRQKLERQKKAEVNRKSEAKKKTDDRANEQKQKKQIQLHHPWRNHGGPYPTAGVVADIGHCIATGLLTGRGGLIGTLPTTCRPQQGRLIFNQYNGDTRRVDALTDGRVYHITHGSANYLSLDGLMFAKHPGPQPQFLWGWRNYGHGYRRASVSRYSMVCAVSGLIRGGRWGYFVHVPQCRPHDGRLIFSANNHAHNTRVDVLTNGHVLRSGGYAHHHWVSLDGIQFANTGGHNIALYNRWVNYGHGYRPAKWMRVGKMCYLSGLIKSPSWHHHITTLPATCRPKKRVVLFGNVHMRSARIDVLPNGHVYYVQGKMHWDWLSLSNVRFLVR